MTNAAPTLAWAALLALTCWLAFGGGAETLWRAAP